MQASQMVFYIDETYGCEVTLTAGEGHMVLLPRQGQIWKDLAWLPSSCNFVLGAQLGLTSTPVPLGGGMVRLFKVSLVRGLHNLV